MPLTAPQRRALVALEEITRTSVPGLYGSTSARTVAEALWPDSPAWRKRTRRYGTNRNGAMGGTMPMNAARLLHNIGPKYVFVASSSVGSTTFAITDATYRLLFPGASVPHVEYVSDRLR